MATVIGKKWTDAQELSKSPRPEGWTAEDRRAWNGLQRRFPGVEAEVERAGIRFAVATGHGAKVRIAYFEDNNKFFARLEGFTRLNNHGHTPIVMPVIPDEHNPNPDKVIREDMEPHRFNCPKECMKAAEEAQRVLLDDLIKLERGF